MKILNLYSGIGGNRKLWPSDHQVTSVELDEGIASIYKKNFPQDELIIGDAHEYLLKNYDKYDFIWSSPPCTTHTRMNKNFAKTKNGKGQIRPRYIDMKLYQEIIFLDNFFEGKYCIENVISYYKPLIQPIQRHRHYYWANFRITSTTKKNPPKEIINITTKKQRKQKSLNKSLIKQDDPLFLAKKYGFEPIDKNIYINGNHSPGQVFRNCVDPEEGQMILDCALNIIRKENINQMELF